ncbi:hypothetical protein BpHYR1_035786 [Brachionus plicatilis]|uniref:Uncharacterized protein n=1 Tax=Brachionus plicatilis TaxID=10195 RepID=A0A3M7RF46_BRAPC|nr:hypothetical protein BpHYR1_035786 [Brachionus plicatilis]
MADSNNNESLGKDLEEECGINVFVHFLNQLIILHRFIGLCVTDQYNIQHTIFLLYSVLIFPICLFYFALLVKLLDKSCQRN